MAKIELQDQKHLWITYPDYREIILDEDKKDVRICDGKNIVKIRFFTHPAADGARIKDILVNDVYVWQKP